jgi:hypothetical protein
MATSGNVDGGTGISGSIAEELAGTTTPIKAVSSNEPADKTGKERREAMNPKPEIRGASLGRAHGQIVQKDESQLDEGAGEGRRQRLKRR